jgi:hypothetical protein
MMAGNGAWPKRHLARAKDMKAFNAQNLKDLRWLRDRVGWHLAFVEDHLMEGMLLARHSRKIAAQVKAEAAAESKMEAKKAMEQGRQEEAVRALLGPRGGLPHLRTDLVKLAHLLHLEVGEKDTIEILKGKIKPMLSILQMKTPAQTQGSAPSTPARPSRASDPSRTPYQTVASSPAPSSAGPDLSQMVTQETLAKLMVDQEQRFQVMMQQTMMSMWQMPQQAFNNAELGSPPDGRSVMSWGVETTEHQDDAMNQSQP